MSLSVNIAAFRLISREISRDLGEKEIKRKRGRALAGEHFYYTRIFKIFSKLRDNFELIFQSPLSLQLCYRLLSL